MNVQHKELNGQGMFYVEEEGHTKGRMSYVRHGNVITIEHTNVDDALKGRGAGKQLLVEAVSWARSKNIRVAATCTFARALFERIPDFHDVWEKDPTD